MNVEKCFSICSTPSTRFGILGFNFTYLIGNMEYLILKLPTNIPYSILPIQYLSLRCKKNS